MTGYESRVDEYMRLWVCGARQGDPRLDALLRPMDGAEITLLSWKLYEADRRTTVSTPGEFTAKAACILIGYWITGGVVLQIVRFGYLLLYGRYDHSHVLKVTIFASTAAVLGIIYAGLRYEHDRIVQSYRDYLKDRQQQVRERT